MVLDLGGGVIPGENSVLRVETRESDEVLGLGYVDGLSINSR